MGYFPENEIFLSKIMSRMTHINNKNKNNCFQIHVTDSFKCKTDDKKLLYFTGIFVKPCIKLQTAERIFD